MFSAKASSMMVSSRKPVCSIDNYTIGDLLGEGAFSRVYAAKCKATGKLYALKKIELAHLDEKYYKLCCNEIALLQSVKSEYVVSCLGSFSTSDDLCAVLEFLDGGDMAQQIEILRHKGTMYSERTVWYYFHQICYGLRDLHARRILHRDLKPANVFLNTRGQVKLGDLGLSRCFSNLTAACVTRVGTEYYMAPERNQSGGYDFKSDIWSLGCMLYEFCALRNPFNGEIINAYALHKKIARGEFIPLPSSQMYSNQLHYFLHCCMSVDPDERPTAELAAQAAKKMFRRFEFLLSEYKRKSGYLRP